MAANHLWILIIAPWFEGKLLPTDDLPSPDFFCQTLQLWSLSFPYLSPCLPRSLYLQRFYNGLHRIVLPPLLPLRIFKEGRPSCRKFTQTGCASQAFNIFIFPSPWSMSNIASIKAAMQRTAGVWTCKLSILCHDVRGFGYLARIPNYCTSIFNSI